MNTLARSTTWASVGSIAFHVLAALSIFSWTENRPSAPNLQHRLSSPRIHIELVSNEADASQSLAVARTISEQNPAVNIDISKQLPVRATPVASTQVQIEQNVDSMVKTASTPAVSTPTLSHEITYVPPTSSPSIITTTTSGNAPPSTLPMVEVMPIKAKPDYAFNPPPVYPVMLREQGIGGVVWLKVWVNEEGKPSEIALKKGSGYRLLDEAALAAVENWRFFPAKRGNDVIASWVEFPVRFNLAT